MKIMKVAALAMSLLVAVSASAQFRGGSAYEDLYDVGCVEGACAYACLVHDGGAWRRNGG